MNYLGLDVGGTKIAAVVMDEQGRERVVTAAQHGKKTVGHLCRASWISLPIFARGRERRWLLASRCRVAFRHSIASFVTPTFR